MVFPLQSENSLLEDFCSSGQRQARTQPPVGTLPGLWKHLATRCCCITWESKGTQCPDAGSCASAQGMPPAFGKDRINKAHPETHATLYKGHPAQWKKTCFSWSSCCQTHSPLCKLHQCSVPFPEWFVSSRETILTGPSD